MKKKILSLLITAVLAVTSFNGCGQTGTVASQKDEETSTQTSAVAGVSQGEEETDHGTLKVSFLTGNIRIAINIIALEKGYFEEEGVTIEQVNLGGMDALTAINEENGALDILNTGFVADVQAIGSGYDLTVIGGTAVEGGAIIAKKGNASEYQDGTTVVDTEAITTAKLGFTRNEAAWVITRQYLLDNGVGAETLTAIEDEKNANISYYADETAVAQAVQKGEVEIGFLPLEYALLYADAYDLELVATAGELQENYVCCREVTSKARLTEKYDAFVAYEIARIRAFEYYKEGETDESIKADVVNIVSNFSGKERDYVETYLYGGVTKYAVDPNTAGVVKYVEAANNSGLLSSSGVDFATYDITQNVDVEAFKEAINTLVEREPDNAFYAEVLEQFQVDN